MDTKINVERCRNWVARDSLVMAKCSRVKYYPFVMESGFGSTVVDVDGNSFIDLLSSAACLNVGHAHPQIVEAVRAQAEAFTHYTAAYFYNTKAIEFAEKLVQITPGTFDKRVAFGLTGSDSNDGAIKFARGYTGRDKIIVFHGAYHGSTYGAISLTHITPNMRRKIGSLIPDVFAFDFPNTFKNGEDDGDRCINQIKKAFSSYLPPEEVAAVIVEPIQGDSGILVPPIKFMQDLYALCQENSILFISEEVQQGFLRTGKWFGIDNFNIVPDLVILGKPIGGGLPLSAIVGREEIMNSLDPPAHLFTFSGNPISCAAGLAALNVLQTPGFDTSVNDKGMLMKNLLLDLKAKYSGYIADVRGLGLSLAVEIDENGDSVLSRTATAKISYRAWERGLILIFLANNVLRIQPPLTITEEEITTAVRIIDQCLADYMAGDIPDSALDDIEGWG